MSCIEVWEPRARLQCQLKQGMAGNANCSSGAWRSHPSHRSLSDDPGPFLSPHHVFGWMIVVKFALLDCLLAECCVCILFVVEVAAGRCCSDAVQCRRHFACWRTVTGMCGRGASQCTIAPSWNQRR